MFIMCYCAYCKFSIFPTKGNGDFITNKKGIIEGRCQIYHRVLDINKSACSHGIESDTYRLWGVIIKHNNKIAEQLKHETNKTMFWNGHEIKTVYYYK